MNKIASFKVDHLNLYPGIYVSRIDEHNGSVVTTFDLRFITPNKDEVMTTGAMHTIEHLGATYLRNSERSDEIIYFGPMGCRTGCYLVMFGKLDSKDVYDLVKEMCSFIVGYKGEIPGAKKEECGNYLDQDLGKAKEYTERYLREITDNPRFTY